LKDGFAIFLFGEDVSSGLRIIRDAFKADVANGGSELDRFDIGALKRSARDVGEEIRLPVTLFYKDELAAADVGDALGVVKFRALRAGARARVMERSKAPALLTSTTEVPPSPTTNNVLVSQSNVTPEPPCASRLPAG